MARRYLVEMAAVGLMLTALAGGAMAEFVNNGGFETPNIGAGDQVAPNPIGSGWTWTGASGIVAGSPFDTPLNNCGSAPFEGAQMAYLEGGTGVSAIEQTVSSLDTGNQYVLSFHAKALHNYGLSVNPFHVSLGGVDVSFGGSTLVTPGDADYSLYASGVFTPTASTLTLRFYDTGNAPGSQLSLIDAVSITTVPEPTTLAILATGLIGLLAYAWRKHR